ncbi:MAG: NAD(P)/FAD-dependent oxidoreductase [bacterium]|nr:NAD(P)/FAD-dependent oxidoreductase [bacterium]
MNKTAIIIGAGPAGLTAAYELLDKTNIKPIIFEQSDDIGGISKTVNYKGNRIDIGGHRFFSKSKTIMDWWQNILPLQGAPAKDDLILKRISHFPEETFSRKIKERTISKIKNPDPETEDKVMLIRNRISRIIFLRKFYDYPLNLNKDMILKLGIPAMMRFGISYLKSMILPIKPENSLEDFFINRFGKELYLAFFKNYTEKVWGISCKEIKPEWGIQRIKGVSVKEVLKDAVRNSLSGNKNLHQKNKETSLIRQYIYPKYGPGQLWEEVANIITTAGGEIHKKQQVIGIIQGENKISGIEIKDTITGNIKTIKGDFFFSTMPIKELIEGIKRNASVPYEVKETACGLTYRSIVVVGFLLKRLKITNDTKVKTINDIIPDNWIYVQEAEIQAGRLQIYNNWSPYMIKDMAKVWMGMEYFCNEGDEFWNGSDEKIVNFAKEELLKLDIIYAEDILDNIVMRMPKTYPVYSGTYNKIDLIKDYLNKFDNLFLIGRNGMHRYNNQDHSMLSAMVAVENIIKGTRDKNNIWNVNMEQEYQEK